MARVLEVGSVMYKWTFKSINGGNLSHLKHTFHVLIISSSVRCSSSEVAFGRTLSALRTDSPASEKTASKKLGDDFSETPLIPKSILAMRARMRKRHGLAGSSYAPSNQSVSSDFNAIRTEPVKDDNNMQLDDAITVDDSVPYSSPSSSHDSPNDNERIKQSRFIRQIKEGSLKNNVRKMDKFISAPFGLMRIDDENLPEGRSRSSSSITAFKTTDIEPASSAQQPNVHGNRHQSKLGIKVKTQVAENSETNIFDKQYFGDDLINGQRNVIEEHVENKSNSDSAESIFDEQYFGDHLTNHVTDKKDHVINHVTDKREEYLTNKNEIPLQSEATNNIFDEQYFKDDAADVAQRQMLPWQFQDSFDHHSTSALEIESRSHEKSRRNKDKDNNEISSFDVNKNLNPSSSTKNVKFNSDHEKHFSSNDRKSDEVKTKKKNGEKTEWNQREEQLFPAFDGIDSNETVFHEVITKRELKSRSVIWADVENPKTAYDLAMKIRLERKKGRLNNDERDPTTVVTLPRESKWSGRVDSKGFKILTEQVVDIQNVTEKTLLQMLKDSIIYDDENIVVLDKPYGLPSHGGPGIHHSVGKFLVSLANKVDSSGRLDTLHLVHRLDKETTGVMVLAKSQQNAEILLAMFKKRQVIKRYWTITKGIPKPEEGVIDIPMAEGIVENRYRMELRPRYYSSSDDMPLLRKKGVVGQTEEEYKKKGADRGGQEAITNYRILSNHDCCALVECQPETGLKHQIRCHLAFGLNTPILGDHKYSHYSKMAPQRLYPEILNRLGIRQSKVRHLPMHLHAKTLILPEFKAGKNLFLSARLPKHFVQNMKWLKLQPPD